MSDLCAGDQDSGPHGIGLDGRCEDCDGPAARDRVVPLDDEDDDDD